MQADRPQPEFSRPVSIARLGDDEAAYPIAASEAERRALARRFGLVALDRFAADVLISRAAGGGFRLKGVIAADIVQDCVVTLEPFASRVNDEFVLIYRRRAARPSEVVDVDEDDFEPLDGDEIDIGEAVAQQLSLSLDPFPRAPGVESPGVVQTEAQRSVPPHPFAELAKLVKK
jgi:uncharacterized metal-binding protein YceD (DUF177 family)